MILLWMILILIGGGVLAAAAGRISDRWPRWICLSALLAQMALAAMIAIGARNTLSLSAGGPWLAELNLPWMPSLGIGFHLAVDGFSLLLIFLTGFLGIMALGSAWTEISEKTGFFHLNLMWVLAGILGVFSAMDLFLFYFFWELMLVPMYFIIAVWGHENRQYAAVKFFLFTQISGLFMLVAILALFFIHGRATGVYTFDYPALLGTDLSPAAGFWLMLAFFAAFAVKLPVVPLHTWLPDAHTQAPTAGSVILAGLLLKTGAYGLMRFAVPLFPAAAVAFAPYMMTLGVISILYGAVMAFAQEDLKRLVAYTSVSHMGFVLLGIFAFNRLALQGVVMTILAHGVSTGALFILVGSIQERTHTRDLSQMGGFKGAAPRMGAAMLLFSMASMGLPGMGNFVGEFLVLIGAYRASIGLTAAATVGFITATIYAVWIVQRVLHGQDTGRWKGASDLTGREMTVMGALALAIFWLGLYPTPVFKTAAPAMASIEKSVKGGLPPGAIHVKAPQRENSAEDVRVQYMQGGAP